MIKVASYCRVSTDHEDQANSFASQQRFFQEYIERNPEWELYKIYADDGITGTSTKKRIQFNCMIRDAYSRKFKLIITKEVSRFSRNILDTISYTRELKALGIGVIFMSDGFSTLDPDAELRLSIMGSIAQEESRKTSSRVKWGHTRQMEKGVVFGRSLLGYDVQNGKMTVNPEGAETIRKIFYMYGIEKKGSTIIARELREAGIKTVTGNPYWTDSHILKILKNEKYVGDLVQKKTITPDYLTHTKKYNHGEEALIIRKNHHEPIISRELWELVQKEILKRNRCKKSSDAHSNRYVFSGKILCAECGARFISRVKKRRDGSTYRRWGCFHASKDGTKKTDIQGNPIGCDVGKLIRDDLAIEMLVSIVKSLTVDWNWIVDNITSLVTNSVNSHSSIYDQPDTLQKQLNQILKKKADAIDAYLSGTISKEELDHIKERYNTEAELVNARLEKEKSKDYKSHEQFFHDTYHALESILTCKTFSESYLKSLLEYMIIHKDSTVDMKLNQLSTIWHFELYKGNQGNPLSKLR